MAWYDDTWQNAGDYFDEDPFDTPSVEDILFGLNGAQVDQHAQDLMWSAMVDKDADAYRQLVEYMWDTYDIDFEDAWDWQDFAEWYETQ